MYIAAVLRKAGYEVEILDAFMTEKDFCENCETVNVGLSFEEIKQEVETRKPDIVGLAGPFTSQIENTIKTSNIIKEVNPDIITVVGGPHVTLIPKEFLEENPNVDVICYWRGEYTILRNRPVYRENSWKKYKVSHTKKRQDNFESA